MVATTVQSLCALHIKKKSWNFEYITVASIFTWWWAKQCKEKYVNIAKVTEQAQDVTMALCIRIFLKLGNFKVCGLQHPELLAGECWELKIIHLKVPNIKKN